MPEIHAKPPRREDCLRLDYVYGGTVTYRPGETLGPRVLTDYELVLIIEGHVTYCRDEREHVATGGAVILARPGFHESYRWDPKHETRHAYLHFNLDAIPRHWPEPALWPVAVAKPDPVCAALVQHIVARCGAQPRWPAEQPPREVCCLMKTLLEALFEKQTAPARATEAAARPAPVQHALKRMREVIDEEPERAMSLREFAAAANVSSKHLCRLFQQHIGRGPMQTYRLLRLQLALVLLSRSNLTIKQIANRCGFASQFQFSRCFAESFRRPPTEVRRRLQRGEHPPGALLPPDVMPRVFW
jgi:AraC family transcriptional regulator